MENNNNSEIKTFASVIKEKLDKVDSRGIPYHLLKLGNEEVIFVFPSNKYDPEGLWAGSMYEFTVRVGREPGSNILLNYKGGIS